MRKASFARRFVSAVRWHNDFLVRYQGLTTSLAIFVTLAFLSSQLSVLGYGSLLTFLVSLISCMVACLHSLYLGVAAYAHEKPPQWDVLTTVFIGCSVLLAVWLWYIVELHTGSTLVGVLISTVFLYFIAASCVQVVRSKGL